MPPKSKPATRRWGRNLAPPKDEILPVLPDSVRYVKNGKNGQWWQQAKDSKRIYAAWNDVTADNIRCRDYLNIEQQVRAGFNAQGKKNGATQDFNALRSLLDRPSQHVWITFEDGFLWWCTVKDDITINPCSDRQVAGSQFWLACDKPWSNLSFSDRFLAVSNLPGTVTMTRRYPGTVSTPTAWKECLRVIRGIADPDVLAAEKARREYQQSVSKLVARLHPKDFELLVDLILGRSGWARVASLGGATEGVDVEVENLALGEIAFVQVKSTATQKMLDDYFARFKNRRDHYDRMIFVVHTTPNELIRPSDKSILIWTNPEISRLVVKLGLGEWVANRV
jgi:hypothetical protein